MAEILTERGHDVKGLNAECRNFKCNLTADGLLRCCCCWILYEEPDLKNAKSILEEECKVRGFKVLFLPKFHCKLNPVEMCWGRAKYYYQLNPPSSKEDDLKTNMLAALDAVTLTGI